MDEAGFIELVSGRRRGLGPSIARATLRCLSCAYATGVAVRTRAFDCDWRTIHRASVPVISVGNITTGGTGKTPFTAFLTRRLTDRGVRVGILSRGYRSLNGADNDEKRVLDALCPSVPHLQQRDRVSAAKRAVREHGCNVLILDDGFQHRRLGRDLDIVLIDALNPWGYGHLLPRGLLREPVESLRRADLIVLTRADRCTPDARRAILRELTRIRGNEECVEVAFPPQRLVNVQGESATFDMLAGRRPLAFCGIGNPAGFRETLATLGVNCELRGFPDHHHYTAADLQSLQQQAEQGSADILLTTQKDLVKIPQTRLGDMPLWGVRIGVRVLSGEDRLESLLQALAERVQPPTTP